jgi:hypothetical protein
MNLSFIVRVAGLIGTTSVTEVAFTNIPGDKVYVNGYCASLFFLS